MTISWLVGRVYGSCCYNRMRRIDAGLFPCCSSSLQKDMMMMLHNGQNCWVWRSYWEPLLTMMIGKLDAAAVVVAVK